jgi:outer membrane protein OmpA-like peptidoglycan-associated protein
MTRLSPTCADFRMASSARGRARPRRAMALCAPLLALWLAACATPESDAPGAQGAATAPAPAPAPAPAAPAPAAPPPILPFDDAVLSAATSLLSKAPAGADRAPLVIDPLIDGVTGMQTQASRAMGARLAGLIRERYSQFDVQPFNATTVALSPLVLVGTFTGVNKERKSEGRREAYRICLALADLKTGKLVSKGLAFAAADGVDTTPTAYFRDNPVWAEDAATTGYIRTCQGTKAGDAIHPQYIERLAAAAWLSEAIDAYNAGKYAQALTYYEGAARLPAGQQLRTFTGIYLSNLKLGRQKPAMEAFGQIVDQGLAQKKLGVKFLFRPGSTAWGSDSSVKLYPLWLSEVAQRGSKQQSCLEVTGHTSPSGPEPMNERLSLLRAEYVKKEVERRAPLLAKRLIANGMGSRESMVGNGKDDASDALDRRVEFKVIGC